MKKYKPTVGTSAIMTRRREFAILKKINKRLKKRLKKLKKLKQKENNHPKKK